MTYPRNTTPFATVVPLDVDDFDDFAAQYDAKRTDRQEEAKEVAVRTDRQEEAKEVAVIVSDWEVDLLTPESAPTEIPLSLRQYQETQLTDKWSEGWDVAIRYLQFADAATATRLPVGTGHAEGMPVDERALTDAWRRGWNAALDAHSSTSVERPVDR